MTEQARMFSPDEVETIKKLLADWGWEYGLTADRVRVAALAARLGLAELAKDLKV